MHGRLPGAVDKPAGRQGVTTLTFVALLLLYMLIYQLDELGIFLAAVISLRASRLEEKHGRVLKLFGGTLMLTLAAVMLFNPSLMAASALRCWCSAWRWPLRCWCCWCIA